MEILKIGSYVKITTSEEYPNPTRANQFGKIIARDLSDSNHPIYTIQFLDGITCKYGYMIPKVYDLTIFNGLGD